MQVADLVTYILTTYTLVPTKGVNLDPDPKAQLAQLNEIHRDLHFAGVHKDK